jgi:hypothetical protein
MCVEEPGEHYSPAEVDDGQILKLRRLGPVVVFAASGPESS